MDLETAPDAHSAAQRAADHIVALAHQAVAERGSFHLAVSGGRTPWLMMAMLAVSDMPWESTSIYQVDERLASPGSPDRNLTHLVLTLPIEKQSTLHPMPVTRRNLDEAAEEYGRSLPERFDVVHLGLSREGHTASLIPDCEVIEVVDRPVAVTARPHEGLRRMTLTLPTINSARSIVWLVTGDEKRIPLARLIAGDPEIPATSVRRDNALLVCDAVAAGEARPTQPLDTDQAA